MSAVPVVQTSTVFVSCLVWAADLHVKLGPACSNSGKRSIISSGLSVTDTNRTWRGPTRASKRRFWSRHFRTRHGRSGSSKQNVIGNVRWGLKKRARGFHQAVKVGGEKQKMYFCVQCEKRKCGWVNVSAEVPVLFLLLL